MPELLLRSTVRRRPPAALFRAVARAFCARHLPHRRVTVELSVVGAARMRALNRAWRGVDHATDVLSVERAVPPVGPVLLGPLVLCPEVARRATTARERSQAYLFAHGLLHCVGWDHRSVRQEQGMDEAVRQLLPARVLRELAREKVAARR